MKQFIPKNLNLDEHLENHPPKEIKPFQKDNLIYIISLISEIPANLERFDSYNGYVPINARTLKKKVNNYKQYLNYLVRTGILETDNHYIIGQKSKGYRFNEKYREKLKDVEVVKYTLTRSIKKDRQIDENTKKKYNYLVKWFDDSLQVNSSAYDYLDSKHNSSTWDMSEMYKYFSAFRNVQRIDSHDYFVSVDSTVGRFHSNLTNLRSDCRNFVTYNNQELVSTDLTNSQPYLSPLLFRSDFYNSDESSLINVDKLTSDTFSFPSLSSSFPPPMVVKILQYADNVDVDNYSRLVRDGVIYEYISREIFDQYHIRLNRKESKDVFFSIMYSGNQFFGQEEAIYKRLFRERFPNVYKIFSLIKSIEKNLLACTLQRIESYIIIDVICKRIEIERPYLPIFTIHDSIATTAGNEDYIKYLMYDEFTRIIGYKPRLKTEFWRFNKE